MSLGSRQDARQYLSKLIAHSKQKYVTICTRLAMALNGVLQPGKLVRRQSLQSKENEGKP
jgi:hypothetical protein